MKDKFVIIIFAVSAMFFFGFGYFTSPKDLAEYYKSENKTLEQDNKRLQGLLNERTLGNVKYDTTIIYKYVQGNTVHITEQGEVTIIRDTIVECKPFIARLDSVCNNDTINVSYSYPNNLFDLRLKLKNDSIPIKYISITKYETQVIKRPIWLDILSHSGAVFIGYAIGKIK